VPVKLYSRKIMAQWQWHFTEEKYWNSDSDTLLKKNIGIVTVTLYWRKMLQQWQWLYCCKILAQWQRQWLENHIGTVIMALYTREILSQWVTLHSRASINFRPHFPSLLIDSGDLRYTGSPRETLHELCVLWRSMPRKAHLTWRRKQNFAPFSTLLVRFVQTSVHEMCTKIC